MGMLPPIEYEYCDHVLGISIYESEDCIQQSEIEHIENINLAFSDVFNYCPRCGIKLPEIENKNYTR